MGTTKGFRHKRHDRTTEERVVRVIRTKLAPPALRADVIHRKRLLDDLRASLSSCWLTLVSAPAGYGKTTILASLPGALPEMPLAWLSLDEEDDDPASFLAALIAALQELEPACGLDAGTLLSNLDNPASEMPRVVGVLIDEILQTMTKPFALVLDDLHRVGEPAAYAALDYLLEHRPQPMHLVVSTRHDPPLALARMRARRQVFELRLGDLCFTPEEAERFLNGTLRLNLSPEHLTTLQRRTEGWAAGISLLVRSLERMHAPADRASFITDVARTRGHVSEFLAEEVLANQQPGVREFLIETSILTELTPALCTAVTGRDDAPETLDDLYRRNLFVTAVDTTNDTFRYHDFFRGFLLDRLKQNMQKERVNELHRRAGEAEIVPSRAIRHYLAARMWSEAAGVIERVGEQTIWEGSLDSLLGWIRALPEDVRESHPRLAYLLGRCSWMRWELNDARLHLEHALEGFEAAGDQAGQSETLVHLATCLSTMVEMEDAEAATRRALVFSLPPHHRAQILVQRAWIALARKDWSRTNSYLDEALALVEASRDPRVLRAVARDFNSPFTVLPGGVERAERLCRLLTAHLGDETDSLQVALHDLAAFSNLWRGRWEEALRAAGQALETSERFGGLLWADAEVGAMLPVCLAVQGDHTTADRYFDALFRGLGRPSAAALAQPWAAGHLYVLGRVRFLQGRLKEAREIYVQMRAAENEREWPMAPVVRAMMEGLIHISDHRYADSERSLRRAAALQHEVRFSVLFGNANLLLAHLYRIWDRPEDALAALEPELAEHERQGAPGLFLWEGNEMIPLLRLAVERDVNATFAAHVLDLFAAIHERRSAKGSETDHALTQREIEVLRLVADGLTDGQVADALHISPRTVGQHLRSVYKKFGVPSRAAATRHAVERRLI